MAQRNVFPSFIGRAHPRFHTPPASLLAPANYAQLLWAALLGWLVFGHIPDEWGLTGMAVIAGSGVFAALGTRRPPVKRSV